MNPTNRKCEAPACGRRVPADIVFEGPPGTIAHALCMTHALQLAAIVDSNPRFWNRFTWWQAVEHALSNPREAA